MQIDEKHMDTVPVPPAADPHTREAVLLVADTIGEIMGFWNFKPSMGRVWTILYLSPEPLAADEIVEHAELSAGSVSMTLQELLQWGVVRKAWRAGNRRRLYEAETDIVSLVTRVFRERELRLIEDAVKRLERASSLLQRTASSQENEFLLRRVDNLLRLARAGHMVVDRFAGGGLLDLQTLRGALQRAQ